MAKKEIPESYRDGCTKFFNGFGQVSHYDICDEHDNSYWLERTYVDKINADIRWFGKILWRHRTNWKWYWAVWPSAIVGLIGLLTLGNWYWLTRHYWDDGRRG